MFGGDFGLPPGPRYGRRSTGMCKTCVVLYTALVGIPPGLWGRGPVAGVRARAARARRSASGTRDPQTRTHMVWCMRFRSPFIKVPHMCEEITFCRALGYFAFCGLVASRATLPLFYPSYLERRRGP